jgi:hypothetical protein
VRELRRKKAESSKKGEAIEVKAAGEATLTPPQGDYRLTTSIVWQRITGSVELDWNAPKMHRMIRPTTQV